MQKYISAKELARKWKVSNARITTLCKTGKLYGARKNGKCWEIPDNVKRPEDNRKTEKSIERRKQQFTFIDLFAGIGGFHQAMASLGGRCIMAAEIDKDCVETYKLNFRVDEKEIRGDVNAIDGTDIDAFDVLCAGFPCQPFSKAGAQQGFNDPERGGLFFRIMEILDNHPEVKFVILENVRNLADKTQNWEVITRELSQRNFYITEEPIILSPSDFGIPQIRERVYILGIRKDIRNEDILTNGCIHIDDLKLDKNYKKCEIGDAWNILEENVDEEYVVPIELEEIIFIWDEFRNGIETQCGGFPVWINSFGLGIDDDEKFRQEIGYYEMPDWKKIYVKKNRALYVENRQFIDNWVEEHNMLDRNKLYQKFEWNCGNDVDDIRDAIVQVRQSGIRVKRADFFPSLVAMVNKPIVWDSEKDRFRYITEREAANLQNFRRAFRLAKGGRTAYRQLGNAVNVKVLRILAKKLFALAEPNWREING